ncbi:hypothetical protein F2Q70_00008542 [Brassica cretica]|uniref:SWIM-type domain-containing protein n=1 Tax=Brassica cretica TaxID=69181 RepID=A0A8S9MC24_BRACR|nr:hypothetical protein F2Q70_00008542 [Brassica cretica]
MMVGWFSSRRAVSLSNIGAVTPKVREALTRSFAGSTGSCSCKEFDALKIPCTHAVSAAVTSKMSAETLVAEEYSNNYWGMAYSGTINPVHGGQVGQAEEGGDGMKLLPPRTRRPPGRPRKCRILSAGEIRGSGVFKRRRTCTKCGASLSNIGAVTPKVHEALTRSFAVSTGYAVRHLMNAEYEVSAVTSKMSVETLVAEEYSNDYWGMAYSGTINPVHGGQSCQDEEGGDGMKLLPPRT